MNPGSKVCRLRQLGETGTVVGESVTFRGWYWVSWPSGQTEMCKRGDLFVVMGA